MLTWIVAVLVVVGVAAAVAFVVLVASGVRGALGDPIAAWGEPVPALAVPFPLLLVSIGVLAVGGLGRVWQTGGGRRRRAVVVGVGAVA
jgi:hypothetical protein